MTTNTDFNEDLETKKNVALMEPIITKLDEMIHKTNKEKLPPPPTYRKYMSSPNAKLTEVAYATLVMVDESYVPSALVLGYTLKKYKCKYNLVCMVQDTPTDKIINGVKTHFPGVSKAVIDDILKVFDVVYGIDLLQIEMPTKHSKHFTERISHYSNISIYVTKSQVFGLMDYKRILYLDASTVAHRNLDYMFEEYHSNTYLWDSSVDKTTMGIHGAVFLIEPSRIFYTKSLYLIKYYGKIFGDKYFKRGIDETILYFTVYPHWSPKLMKIWTRCTEDHKAKKCPIYHYQIVKPFKPIPANTPDKDKYTFQIWDKFAKELLIRIPLYKKYFEHIGKFRQNGLANIKSLRQKYQ